ncbi:hypothetical protein [Endozoicomonas sp. 8E]|uniref:hypothetical protein n=1 Tax=Endozoicomonas sp. 8E TaxID=3035692 RepID=UPI002938D937|nr:hypothetical protein [Endozoicomonas sp. 8E]WOG30326.1 hypothetical protein P6910_11980 [Endozoicomonas sp. 8E]
MISHSITQLPKTTRSSKFSHRTKAKQLVAGTLGTVIMACLCPALMAANPLLITVDERFFGGKGTKESDYLSGLINHNALKGWFPSVTGNDNDLIFVMNHGNDQGEDKNEDQEQPQGAGAPQMQPLMYLPLPPMSREQIAEIIRKLNTGLPEDTLTILLNNIPEAPPGDNLTIASMIEQVASSLHVQVDQNQNAILETLSHIRGTGSPVNLNNRQQQQSFAYLMLGYYTAINSSAASPQSACATFTSFLLHAADMAGIFRLHLKKDKLLGKDKPIKNKDVLKENVAKSSSVFSGLKYFQTERIKLLQQLENASETEQSDISVDALLRDVIKLINRDIDRNAISLYKRQRKTAERMLDLIEKYGRNEPELVAWSNQFFNLIDIMSLMLDHFAPEYEDLNGHIVDMEDYFRRSGKKTSFHFGIYKKKELFKEFQKVIVDSIVHQENQDPELFKNLIRDIKIYVVQKLHLTFTDQNDCLVIMVTLTTGFRALLEQSYELLAVLSDTTIGSDSTRQTDEIVHDEMAKVQEGKVLSKKEKRKKHLQERLKYLEELVQCLEHLLGRSKLFSDCPYNSESESCDSDREDSDREDFDESDSDRSDLGRSDLFTLKGVTQ